MIASRVTWIVALQVALVSSCLCNHVHACKVPVFRYALERWPSDDYRIVALVDGPMSDDVREAVARLQSISRDAVNITTEVIDLAELTDDELWSVEGIEDTDQTPLLQVYYPQRDGQRKPCWSGALTLSNVKRWIDSPLRQRIAEEIQSGVSAVWVLVEGADATENETMNRELESALAEAAASIAVPDGVISRQGASQYLRDNPAASMDDVLRTDIPLRIEFSIQRLRHGDQDEFAVRTMVDGWSSRGDRPFVFPVFGRGRMIDPLPASEFNSGSVVSACRYLVGECSCSVKALNPGIDLILSTNWKDQLGEQIVLVDAAYAGPVEIAIPPGNQEPLLEAESSDSEAIAQADDPFGKYWVFAMMALGALAFTLKLRMSVGKA